MALKTEDEKRICKKYSAQDKNRNVHCHECPLNYERSFPALACKAIGEIVGDQFIYDDDDGGESGPVKRRGADNPEDGFSAAAGLLSED